MTYGHEKEDESLELVALVERTFLILDVCEEAEDGVGELCQVGCFSRELGLEMNPRPKHVSMDLFGPVFPFVPENGKKIVLGVVFFGAFRALSLKGCLGRNDFLLGILSEEFSHPPWGAAILIE